MMLQRESLQTITALFLAQRQATSSEQIGIQRVIGGASKQAGENRDRTSVVTVSICGHTHSETQAAARWVLRQGKLVHLNGSRKRPVPHELETQRVEIAFRRIQRGCGFEVRDGSLIMPLLFLNICEQ